MRASQRWLLLGLLLGGCGGSGGGVAPDLGAECESPADCTSGRCEPVSDSRAGCSSRCKDAEDCPSGWSCATREGHCACEADEESCNGADDDCDGASDEGTGAEVGCPVAMACVDASCVCDAGEICDGTCVDTRNDPAHCGGCDAACAEGEVCNAGECCVAAGESCNGRDDDCDGAVDEGVGPEVGCGDNELCMGSACTCPSMCAGSCVDLDGDRAHCGRCDSACAAGEICDGGECCAPATPQLVDLLLVVDASNSMAEEQKSFAEALPRLVQSIVRGELTDPDTGETVETFEPVFDLQVGVVSTDMGAGGFDVPTCGGLGDDGILRREGNPGIVGCMASYPPFLSFDAGSDEEAFAEDAECLVQVGTDGCGWEQPLEAMLKAVAPSDFDAMGPAPSQLDPFLSGSGHGAGENAGFLRPDSLLAVVVLTDEDDCSIRERAVFDPDSSTYDAELNVRCFEYPETRFPLDRYVEGLLALRGEDPSRLLFAAIAGVPTDLEGSDLDAMLEAPRMQERLDPDAPFRLVPSCESESRGLAFPPRRLVRTAARLQETGAAGVVRSICRSDLTSAMDAIARRIGERSPSRTRCHLSSGL